MKKVILGIFLLFCLCLMVICFTPVNGRIGSEIGQSINNRIQKDPALQSHIREQLINIRKKAFPKAVAINGFIDSIEKEINRSSGFILSQSAYLSSQGISREYVTNDLTAEDKASSLLESSAAAQRYKAVLDTCLNSFNYKDSYDYDPVQGTFGNDGINNLLQRCGDYYLSGQQPVPPHNPHAGDDTPFPLIISDYYIGQYRTGGTYPDSGSYASQIRQVIPFSWATTSGNIPGYLFTGDVIDFNPGYEPDYLRSIYNKKLISEGILKQTITCMSFADDSGNIQDACNINYTKIK